VGTGFELNWNVGCGREGKRCLGAFRGGVGPLCKRSAVGGARRGMAA
jgi:hypothetical protein